MAATKAQREMAVRAILETFDNLGVSELSKVLSVEWKNSFTARMGDARYRRSMTVRLFGEDNVAGSTAKIRLSVPLWSLASEEERRETAIHEACHIVDSYLAAHQPGYSKDGHHGNSWKALMDKCGAKGDRCHYVERPARLKRKKWDRVATAKCGCRTFQLTNTKYKRLLAGTRYYCKKCLGTLTVVQNKV